MDAFDYVIMGTGVALIIIGLLIFISGKRESANHNQVEGFGIKLNVSNPSIILIVFGIGLLLVPRLLPRQTVFQPQNQHLSDQSNGDQASQSLPSVAEQKTQESQVLEQKQTKQQTTEPSNQISQNTPPTAWLPIGLWEMTGYELNGVDQTGFVRASIEFTRRTSTKVYWASNFVISDVWGNVSNFHYQGEVSSSGGAYTMIIRNSNDPSFRQAGAIPIELKLENNQQLHFEYYYSGAKILTHWMQ